LLVCAENIVKTSENIKLKNSSFCSSITTTEDNSLTKRIPCPSLSPLSSTESGFASSTSVEDMIGQIKKSHTMNSPMETGQGGSLVQEKSTASSCSHLSTSSPSTILTVPNFSTRLSHVSHSTYLSTPPSSLPVTSSTSTSSSFPLPRVSLDPSLSPPVCQVSFISDHPVKLCPAPVELLLPSDDQFLYHSLSPDVFKVATSIDTSIPMKKLEKNGILCPHSPQPLITVTINPLEQDEVTFIPPSPMLEMKNTCFDERRSSIGSSSSMEDEDRSMLGLSSFNVRRVSDISHINELRREISGLSHLASEFYTIKKVDDLDTISLDSLHVRTLSRCAKYQALPPSSQSRNNKYFVIITTSLTIMGISYGFWFKNFSGMSSLDH